MTTVKNVTTSVINEVSKVQLEGQKTSFYGETLDFCGCMTP